MVPYGIRTHDAYKPAIRIDRKTEKKINLKKNKKTILLPLSLLLCVFFGAQQPKNVASLCRRSYIWDFAPGIVIKTIRE